MHTAARPLSVYLAACVGDTQDSPVVRAWHEAAARDVHGVHRVTDDPAHADIILFVDLHLAPDWRLPSLLSHELVRRHPGKAFVYDERDHPWCALPGLYCSMPEAHFDPDWQRACAYYGTMRFTEEERAGTTPDLLFSFVGSRSHPVRRSILRLTHTRAALEDTSGFLFYDRSDPAAYDRQRTRYLSILLRSKFVLCPAGAGTSSIRLFETLAAGRVPVIISDAWVPPPGPSWGACSLRVPEAAVADLPRLLEATEPRYPQMSAAAQQAHAEWFAPTVIFHRLISGCGELLARGAANGRPPRGWRYLGLGVRQAKHHVRGSVGKLLRAAHLR